MKKIFFFLAAMALAITANAKVTTISPDAENDALRLAVHYAEDGDIIEMTEGTYVQCNNGYVAFDGKSVTVKAAEGANVVLQLQVPITLANGGKATLQGIKIDASRLTELADWYEHVIYANDATEGKQLVMDGCELYSFNMNKSAIYSKADNKLDLCRITNCYFHDVEKSCLFFEGTSIAELSVTNSTFANNIAKVTGSYYAGIIDVRNADAKVTVDHCTFYNCLLMNTDYAAITMKGPQAANVVISNNIFMLPEAIDGHRAIRESVEATNCMTFNYVKDNGGIHSSVTKTNCQLNVDPLFVDTANCNFALADGSPAIGAATDGSNLGDPRWNAPAVEEPEYDVMDITMTNLVVQEMEDFVVLTASDDSNTGLNVMLAVNEDGSLAADSYMALIQGWNEVELPIVEGNITKAYNEELATDVYTGLVVVEYMEGKLGLNLTMYAKPVVVTDVVVTDATITVETGDDGMGGTYEMINVTANWNESVLKLEGVEKEFEGFLQITETFVVDGEEDWYIWMCMNGVITTVDNVLTVTGEFKNNFTGDVYNVTISGKLPVVEEPEVEKPEPTYTENKLNPYAFGLESVLSDDKATLTVTYRLNNSNATSVNVVVYNGEKVVATVPGTTTIGKNTVEVATGNLPAGVELKWAVEVNGTSVAAPTQEAKIHSFYHPSGLDIDNNPENPTFGMLLINEGMQSVASKTEGYVSAQFGAGIFAFTPSLDLIPNGELPGYNGGIEFTTGRADAPGSTAYSPRRIRISEDGRIFVTSLNTDGNYLWEVNPANMNEWTPVFKGTLNEQAELIDADGNFVAAPNSGFDVKGAGENLQLAMYSANIAGIGTAMSGFRLHEYNLGTATTWTTAPSKALVEGKYAINYTGTQVEYDNEGGFWIASYRGTANDANPGLVHINKDGVEDAKLIWSNVRQAGIRFNKDFTKLVVAGNNGAAKKATVYAVSKDANGAPVLTEETVIDMAVVGNNLNDFAFDYAGNLYSCGNSSEKLVGWAMPYSGKVETPAAAKYAFQLPEPIDMVGTVKRAVQNGNQVIVLTHDADGTAHIYQVINGKPVAELSQTGVIARDPENAGDLLAISDIAVTEDGKLVATNYMITQSDDGQVVAGDKRGETRIYIWNDLAADPTILLKSKMSSNWFQSKQGLTMAVKGTSDNMEIFMTGIHKSKAWARVSSYRIINGVYTEPDVNHNDHYFFYDVNDAIALETTVGTQYELSASPLGKMNWILDANLINPVEIVESAANNTEIATSVALAQDLGKKYQGTSIVTVGEQHLMVAPYANADGKLAGVKVLDITAGLDKAAELKVADLDAAVEATAVATAVAVKENVLTITLVADAALHTLVVELAPATSGITLTATGVETELEEDGSYTLEGKAVVNGDESNLMDFALFVYPTEGYTDVVLNNYSVMIFGAPTPDAFVENEDGTFTYTAQIEDTYGDGTIYNINISGTIKKTEGPVYTEKEDEITNMVFDFDNMVMYGGPSTNYEVEVFLGLAEDNLDGTFTLSSESSVAIKGIDAEFIEGYAYDIDLSAPSAKAVVKVNWDGMYYAFTLTMTAAPLEAIEIVITDATVEVEEWKDFPEAPTTNYALTMTADWTNPADSVVYPVKVELPIYDPNATEPVDALSMVKVGDGENLLGVIDGEYLKVTTVEGVVTATGLVANPATNFAVNITISGKLPETAVDNIQVGVKAVKVIINGQLIIIKNGVQYNALGQVIK